MLRTTRCIKLTTFFALAVLLAAPLYAAPATSGVADVLLGSTQVDWVPTTSTVSHTLIVSGPTGVVERTFGAGETPFFDLTAITGDVDGAYSWQLTATPDLSAESRRLMAEARSAGTTFQPNDLPPRDQLIQSGHFRVVGGAIVQPTADPEPQLGIATGGEGQGVVTDGIQYMAEAAQVFATDLIVQGSACIGFDCVSGESFGFDTIRLKENNLRIKFQDTSSSGSFPSNDWQITINGSGNGDPSYYRIDDVTNGRSPFTIEAGTPNHTLYVDQTGRIGVGTDVPVVEVHVKDGDTPTLRLQQDGSAGFAQQIWDVAGNETNFFVRDVTNGSKLAFKIKPGAPDNSLFVAANGDIGFGTQSPAERMHVTGSSGSTRMLIEETNASAVERDMLEIANNGNAIMRITNTAAGAEWRYGSLQGNFQMTKDASGVIELQIQEGGNAIFAGQVTATAFNPSSSRSLKENFEPVDPTEILARVKALPVMEWEFIRDGSDARHLGPFAEDFHRTFRLNGEDSAHINLTDLGGVALAAIQGLSAVVDQREVQIDELERLNASLLERVEALELKVSQASQ